MIRCLLKIMSQLADFFTFYGKFRVTIWNRVLEDAFVPFHGSFIHCRVAEALILGSMMVGQATAFAPNYNKAVIAAARIFKLLDRQPVIDSEGTKGVKLVRHIASLFLR